MAKTPSIPEIKLPDRGVHAMKEVLETITAKRPGVAEIQRLASTASNAQIVAKINELIDRLQS
jgi:hypothetical protein